MERILAGSSISITELKRNPSAVPAATWLKEWRKLAAQIRDQYKAKLRECLEHPYVVSARLHGLSNCYKIN